MKQNRKQKQKGFTLIEIMIVLAIVGMLFSFVGVNLMNKFKESKVSGAKVMAISAVTGEGVKEVLRALQDVVTKAKAERASA